MLCYCVKDKEIVYKKTRFFETWKENTFGSLKQTQVFQDHSSLSPDTDN